MILNIRTDIHLVLVMDGGRARLFRVRRAPRSCSRVLALESRERHSPARELQSDANGRTHHVTGPAAHVKQPRTDPREQEEQRFVDELVRQTAGFMNSEGIEHLVLVADPRTLGRLRKALGEPLASRVAGEFAVDLAGFDDAETEQRIWHLMGWAG